MKKNCYILLTAGALLLLLFSCQRELNFDILPAQGSLQDSAGNCFPKNIHGTYTAGINTGDSNFAEVSVNVTRAGDFTIVSDTINGYFFKAEGNFADTGLYKVKLLSKGTPVFSGRNGFTATFNGSTCIFYIDIADAPGSAATYTLLGAPDTCSPVAVIGSYIKDVAIGNNDSVIISLNVSVGGTYNISTNEVNGYKFYGNGYADAGIHEIALKGIGAPLNAGMDVFTVTAGNSACSFSVNVTVPTIVTGIDYFPLSYNNYWTYDDKVVAGDTIKRIITDSVIHNAKLYYSMHEYDRYGQDILSEYRKTGNDYFQYGPVDTLTASLKYVPGIMGDIHFLQQPLLSGDTWMSDEYTGTLFSGQTVYLQYNFICVESNTAITVNNHSFINVYHIIMVPQVRSSQLNPFNNTGEQVDLYYAKGVGLVYLKYMKDNFRKRELALRYWNIN